MFCPSDALGYLVVRTNPLTAPVSFDVSMIRGIDGEPGRSVIFAGGLVSPRVAKVTLVWGEHSVDAELGNGTYLARLSYPNSGLRPPTSYLLLGLLAVLVFLPWLHLQVGWTGLLGFLAGSALLVLRPVLGWTVFLLVVVAVAWAQFALVDFSPRAISQITVAMNLGLITYGLTWMARMCVSCGPRGRSRRRSRWPRPGCASPATCTTCWGSACRPSR